MERTGPWLGALEAKKEPGEEVKERDQKDIQQEHRTLLKTEDHREGASDTEMQARRNPGDRELERKEISLCGKAASFASPIRTKA